MGTSTSFLIGCVGAIAPEILRFYKLRSSIRISWSWGYILVSIPFILLGGLVACLLEPQNYYAAFYAGVSTPFIVNAIVKETQPVAKSQDIPVVKEIALDNPRGGEYVAEKGKGIRDRNKEKPATTTAITSSSHKRKMNLQDFFRAL